MTSISPFKQGAKNAKIKGTNDVTAKRKSRKWIVQK